MSKGNKGFGALLTDNLEEEASEERATPSLGVMASRTTSLARLAAGKTVIDRTEWVDPVRCRPWRMHNRDLDHLNEESCADLIDGFKSAKKQRLPAIVRRLKDDPDHDYEIIAGVRRWWTVQWLRAHHHPEFEYLVTVQQVTDEEAFRISDIENRSRKDITDWERAQEYTRALAEFYDNSQAEMAEHIAISRSWLSRLIDVARLPEEIVAGFADRHAITVRIARDIKPLLADPRSRDLMIAEAGRLAAARGDGEAALGGAETAKRLIKATEAKATERSASPAKSEIRSERGKPMIRYSRAGRGGGLTIQVVPRSGAAKGEIMKAIEGLLPSTP